MGFLRRVAKKLIPRRSNSWILGIYFLLRGSLYHGNRFHCPCCGGRFRKLLHSGLLPRPNAKCPRCGSLERHRLLWLFLTDRSELLFDQAKVLHVAPEFMLQKLFRRLRTINYVSADLDSPRAQVKMDITDIQYDANSFDFILCSHVLEHVMDDRKAMRELYRILKPGGCAVLQSPIDLKQNSTYEDATIVSTAERERVFGQRDHVRIYGRDYRDRLMQAGFHVRTDSYVKELGADRVEKYCLIADEDIYVCTKPKAGAM